MAIFTITKADVVAYDAGVITNPDLCRAIEEARDTDPLVQYWFDLLDPDSEDEDVPQSFEQQAAEIIAPLPADELRQRPVPEVHLDSPEHRELAAITYLSVERRAPFAALAALLHMASRQPVVAESPPEITPRSLLHDGQGTLVYREQVPFASAASHRPRSMKPVEIPWIRPDFASGQLVIRQWARDLPGSAVTVFAAKLIGPGRAEIFEPKRIELVAAKHPTGEAYWYQEMAIRDLVPNLQAGDDLFFYAEPAAPNE